LDLPRPKSLLRRAGEASLIASAAFALGPAPVLAAGLSPLAIALIVAFLILSLGIHEAAHAWVAWRCGDSTAKDLGRMTLNPIAHIDPWMTIIIPGLLAAMGGPIFGGAKPVPVSYHRLRHPLRDMALVALAGPASNFLIAIVFAVAWKLCLGRAGYEPESLMAQVLLYSMFANIMLTAFNLLPIPPLDGSRVMTWLLPASLRPGYQALERFGILIVFLALYLPPVRRALNEMQRSILEVVDALTSVIA
jgi:Zn-dependent protease